ncbi:MAG: T9SS type A sorting domain-containing protein [Candidatus Latescibacteria bacterium]|nr:T9SS type A sorting domain-containing protein [Candidatus Latescibacterota bacterium]
MKKYICMLLLITAISYAGTIFRTFTFSESDLSFQKFEQYYIPHLAGLEQTQEIGNPGLPMAVYNVLVPASAEVTSITVENSFGVEIDGQYNIMPTPEFQPFSLTEKPLVTPDPFVYAQNTAYPDKLVEYTRTTTKSGYRLAGFFVYPLQYVPTEQKLILHKNITVKISYQESKVIPLQLTDRQKQVFEQEIRTLVINPEDLSRFAPQIHHTDTECNYLLITTEPYLANFQPLVDWRNKQGWKAEIVTVNSLTSTYPGRDVPEKIRNGLINYYQTRGLIFAVLGGDTPLLPPRIARVISGSYTGNIPCDLYFSDLDGTWDANNNNIFGEVPGDGVDMNPDIYVGRASIDNATEANTFVNKILFYEKTPTTDYLKKILLPSVMLFSSYNYHGRVVNETIANVTPAGWLDRNMIDPSGTSPMRESLNVGFHFCHPSAHGSEVGYYTQSSQAIYLTSDAYAQTNAARPYILNSIACNSGDFGYSTECLAEAMMNNPNGGAVATIQNSRYGWGQPPNLGPSEWMDVKFYDFLLRQDSFRIGVAHARSKSMYTANGQSQSVWRWCIYELNLFGDPAMPMWTEIPQPMIAQYPVVVPLGPSSFPVQVTKSLGNPVANALVSIQKDDEVYVRGYTDNAGLVNLQVQPMTPGRLHITITAQNCYPYQDSAMVQSNGAYVAYLSSTLIDSLNGDGDGIPNPGEVINMRTWVKNWGNALAQNVQGKLRLASTGAAISDSVKMFGNITANDSAHTGDIGFGFTVAPNCTNNQRINLQLICTDALDSTWQSNIVLTVAQCVLSHISTIVNDVAPGGNNNGIINLGETVNLITTLHNTGNATAANINAVLTTTTPGVTVINANSAFNSISPNNTANNASDPYIISVDSTLTPGTLAQFRLIAISGYYTDTFYFSIPIEIYLLDLEDNNGYFTADPLTGAWQWGVPTSGPNNAYSGVRVWATVLGGNYANSANWKLTSEPYIATIDNPQLRFWHWYDMELSSTYPGRAYDGGNLKISANNGATWNLIRPVNGYNGLGYTTTSGIANESCYSGVQNTWTEAVFNLPILTGQQFLIRWHFGSDAAVQRAGWYLDDITGIGFTKIMTALNEDAPIPNQLTTVLFAPKPNPVKNGLARISFSLAEPSRTLLKIYDASGRIVKTLVNAQLQHGVYDLTWDGTNQTGYKVAQGIYFCRLKTERTNQIRKLTIIK